EPMVERLALLAASTQQLKQKLAAFLERGAETLPSQPPLDERVARWMAGEDVDWTTWFETQRPRRRSLTSYAFSHRNFPLPRPAIQISPPSSQDISTGKAQARRVDVPFTGREFFIEHHTVQGQPLLPAVMYLEAVRASFDSSTTSVRFEDIVW